MSFEVVNDLKKQSRNHLSSGDNVAFLAYKLDRFHSRPNEMHTNIVRNELLEGLQTNLFKHDIYNSQRPENKTVICSILPLQKKKSFINEQRQF